MMIQITSGIISRLMVKHTKHIQAEKLLLRTLMVRSIPLIAKEKCFTDGLTQNLSVRQAMMLGQTEHTSVVMRMMAHRLMAGLRSLL